MSKFYDYSKLKASTWLLLPRQVSRGSPVGLQRVLTSIIPEIKNWVPWSKNFFVKFDDARALKKKKKHHVGSVYRYNDF